MKLFSICTPPAAALKYDWFLKTMQDAWEPHIFSLDTAPPGNGDYLSPAWYFCIRKKIDILLEAIAASPGEIIIWADIDIQFFRPCADIISRCMPGNDIVFQRWTPSGDEINTGFMAIRCNDRSRAFFEAVAAADFSRRTFADQDAINDLLRAGSPPLSWAVFPRTVYHVFLGAVPAGIALHHACGTPPPGMRDGRFVSSMEYKVEQFRMIRRYVKLPWWRKFLRRANQLCKRP